MFWNNLNSSLTVACCFAIMAPVAALCETEKPSNSESGAGELLATVLAAQPADIKTRYTSRHPAETMTFCQVREGDTVIETLPGRGWYSRILYAYLGNAGKLIAAHYPRGVFERFGWDEKRIQSLVDRDASWSKNLISETAVKGSATDSYTITKMPDRFVGIADKVLFIRSLHNLSRFNKETGYLNNALAEAFRSLKPGGVACVVQHRASETASNNWADGSNGYLKQSSVVSAFEAAGFKFEKAGEINANPKDRPSKSDSVWRLPPTLRGVKENTAKWREYSEVGESDRMTLKFVKPSE